MAPLPPGSRNFMGAEHFAVVGRVLDEHWRWDNQVLRWYQERGLDVTPVRPPSDRVDNTKPIEGVLPVNDVMDLPDLPNTSISMIVASPMGLEMMKRMFPVPRAPEREPRSVWFQPGAESAEIAAFVQEHGIDDKVVMGNHACVLVTGDQARKPAYKSAI